MYDIIDYAQMVADVRTTSYARALAAQVQQGAVVLDMGTGVGIFAFLACQAGAGRVYAVDPDDVIEVAREAAGVNGFADRIEFIQAMTTAIDLPQKVDGIVAEVRGVLPLFGTGLQSIVDARSRLLKSGGWIIPWRDTLWAALVSCAPLHQRFAGRWQTAYGLDFSMARARAVNRWRRQRFKAEDLASVPSCWATLDYGSLTSLNVAGVAAWTVDVATIAHGIAVWFDCETTPGIQYSNSPISRESQLHDQAFLPWPEATQLSAGDHVDVRLRADFVRDDYIWSWETRVTDGPRGLVKAHYRQSTFHAHPFSSDRLRRRSESFVPTPNDELPVDREILDLLGQRLSLGEIAKRIVAEFPDRCVSVPEALTRVADLAERYSR